MSNLWPHGNITEKLVNDTHTQMTSLKTCPQHTLAHTQKIWPRQFEKIFVVVQTTTIATTTTTTIIIIIIKKQR